MREPPIRAWAARRPPGATRYTRGLSANRAATGPAHIRRATLTLDTYAHALPGEKADLSYLPNLGAGDL